MEKYLVEAYNKKLKERKIKTGIGLYGKGARILIWISFIAVIAALISQLVCFTCEVLVQIKLIDIKCSEKGFYIWQAVNFAVMIAFLIVLVIVDKLAMKKATETIGNNFIGRFKALEEAYADIYHRDRAVEAKECTGISNNKLDFLIEVYEKRIEAMKEDRNKRYKFLPVFVGGVGATIKLSLSEKDSLGLSINDWVDFVFIMLLFALVGYVILVLWVEISPTRRKYENLISVLRQYKIYSNQEEAIMAQTPEKEKLKPVVKQWKFESVIDFEHDNK